MAGGGKGGGSMAAPDLAPNCGGAGGGGRGMFLGGVMIIRVVALGSGNGGGIPPALAGVIPVAFPLMNFRMGLLAASIRSALDPCRSLAPPGACPVSSVLCVLLKAY